MTETKKTDGDAGIQPTAPKKWSIKNQVGRDKMVSLDYPISDGETEINEIKVRRCLGSEIKAYWDALDDHDPKSGNPMPLIPTIECDVEVWEALDADDRTKIEEAAENFMPRQLKEAAMQFAELNLKTGENSSG